MQIKRGIAAPGKAEAPRVEKAAPPNSETCKCLIM